VESLDAWQSLAKQYWKPLYAFCRRKGDSPSMAEDRVQGFFASLIERGTMSAVDPARGRFRNWLLGAINRHRQSEWRKEHAAKRYPKCGFHPGDIWHLEEDLAAFPTLGPDRMYERQWAESVLAQVRESMRERYLARGLTQRFEAFWSRLPPGLDSDGHRELAASLGMSSRSLATALWQFRRQYGETLRWVVRRTMDVDADVEEEIRTLIRAVSS